MENKVDLLKIKSDLSKFSDKFDLICKKLKFNELEGKLINIQKQMDEEAFWDDIQKASIISREYKEIKKLHSKIEDLKRNKEDLIFLLSEMPDEEIEIDKLYKNIQLKITELEVESLLNGKYDDCNIFLDIHPGAGGVESHDFAQMLLDMYEKYLGKKKISYEIIDYNKGDVAGIKSVTLEIKGIKAYGFLKNETGIHRLIRISPFDSGNRRHTSFASVKVTPIIENEDLKINDIDLKIDTFRSSGAGGQSVNTTDSAVRITHMPTGIVVSCQNERSQIQNKESAMKVLRAKVYDYYYQKQLEETDANRKNTLGTGARSEKIRTYNYPQNRVTDHRIGLTLNKLDQVMDGKLNEIIDRLTLEEQMKLLSQK